jgi:glycosyltransferase involved in cell wall biosynthesis
MKSDPAAPGPGRTRLEALRTYESPSSKPVKGILLITGPTSKEGQIFTGHLLAILKKIAPVSFIGNVSDADALAGLEKHYPLRRPLPQSNIVFRTLNYLAYQVQIARAAIGDEKAEIALFFLFDSLVVAMLLIKVFRPRMKIVSFPGGRTSEMYRRKRSLLYYPFKLLQDASFALSDRIILYSTNLIKEWEMGRYAPKIWLAHEHYLDFDRFRVKVDYRDRPPLVGYLGRLSEEKGILELVRAMPGILQSRRDLSFLIIGDGHLSGKVKGLLDEHGLNDRVKMIPWVPHDDLPDQLNLMRLMVLPSYTEGLPNVMIESMACGTPFLARPVGAIPDVVKDGVTGFLMPDNSPACIAENVIRAIEHDRLDLIIANGRRLIGDEFSFEAAVERYRSLLGQL